MLTSPNLILLEKIKFNPDFGKECPCQVGKNEETLERVKEFTQKKIGRFALFCSHLSMYRINCEREHSVADTFSSNNNVR